MSEPEYVEIDIDEYFSRPVPIDTSPEGVARAVRYMEQWMPVGSPSIGLGTVSAINVLMQFAREHTPEETP